MLGKNKPKIKYLARIWSFDIGVFLNKAISIGAINPAKIIIFSFE